MLTSVSDLVYTGTQLFRSIFVPVSGTEKQAFHMGTERLRNNFVCVQTGRSRSVDMFSIFLFRRERSGTIAHRSTFLYQLFSRSIVWNGTVLFEVFRISFSFYLRA